MTFAVLLCFLAAALVLIGAAATFVRALQGFHQTDLTSKPASQEPAAGQVQWQTREDIIQQLERQFNNSPSSTDLQGP
ncbi:hypothetical protein [Leptolyngbya sp. FACHB-261]|uniref:hypothetical protein n=1 Tax=Leptolyngbya sp. FACHB-261 TaxID=2692806 RepID=UPI001685E58A|nr:hypothetical protein [Leptolyngbya sp. FACHB-261]MBD2101302.1 hypothetical protein [Leptolyngbya sp. FACHB-261]